MDGPGLHSCAASQSNGRAETPLERKQRFEVALRDAELGGPRQGAETAKHLHIARTTLVGWRNPQALDRVPTDEAFEILAAMATIVRLSRRFRRSA